MLKLKLLLVMPALLVVLLTHTQGDDSATDENAIETVHLSLAAAAEPRPALRYQLLPALSERTPGNAAPYYYRALLLLKQDKKEHWKKYDDNQERWLKNELTGYPKQEVADWLQAYSGVLSQVKTAAYREYCDWDLRVQDLRGMETISFLLPDAQECRQLARILQVQAHLQIMDGRYDDALGTLRQGYRLAQDVARTPILINGLIGIAISGVMNQELLALIEHSPANYYWAIAALPQPLIDLRPALEYEMNLPYKIFPFLKDAETVQRTPDEWRRLIMETMRDFGNLTAGAVPRHGWEDELAATALIARIYPVAKERLIAGGFDRQKVAAMPVGQVVAIQTDRATQNAYHEIFKTTLLPPHEAMRRLPEVMQRMQKDILRPDAALSGEAGIPIASVLLPGVANVMQAQIRPLRQFAALQAIEALRMYAAEHDGKLPLSLKDVTAAPPPEDVATRQPFPYRYDAASGTATLEIPPLAGVPARGTAKRYIIKIEK